MIVKSAQLGYEDEKFSHLVAVHEQGFRSTGKDRILARPELGKGAITAKVCRRDGSVGLMTVTKRHKDSFRRARKKQRGNEI